MIGLKNAVSMRARVMWVRAFMNTYKRRVIAAGGYIEGEQCAIDKINGNNILKEASWRLIPEGIKEDVVYAQKPTDGLGDLTFTRASDATRTNSAGVIERTPWNLLRQSETFSNAVWVSDGTTTVTENTETAPNGTLTADRLQMSASQRRYIYQTTTPTQTTYTYSVYLRANSNQTVRISVDQGCSNYRGGLICNVTTQWQRFSITLSNIVISSGSVATVIDNITSNTNACTGTAVAVDIYAWGAQLVEGTDAKPYFATTNRQDVPRLDYRNADGSLNSCPRLLLEPQRTNLHANSETGASFGLSSVTYSSNVATSPDGYTNADKLVEDATTNVHRVSGFGGTMANTTTYTSSFFAKKGERDQVYILIPASVTSSRNVLVFNLTTGVSSIQSGTNVSAHSMVDYGNGWYRCIATFTTATVSGNNLLGIWVGGESYAGDGTSGLFLWGYMNELGAYATSYIPTLGAAVTRLADAAFKTGVSSLIGQTEGTLFAEVDLSTQTTTGLFRRILMISEGDENTSTYLRVTETNTLQFVSFNGTVQALINSLSPTVGRIKVAAAYKANDFILYINGVLQGTDTAGTIPATRSVIRVGQSDGLVANHNLNDRVTQAALFPTRLTNAQLAQLTT
jgi:hypothetical protein